MTAAPRNSAPHGELIVDLDRVAWSGPGVQAPAWMQLGDTSYPGEGACDWATRLVAQIARAAAALLRGAKTTERCRFYESSQILEISRVGDNMRVRGLAGRGAGARVDCDVVVPILPLAQSVERGAGALLDVCRREAWTHDDFFAELDAARADLGRELDRVTRE